MRIGMVYSRARVEEKMLQEAAARKGVELAPVQDDTLVFDLDPGALPYDVVLERSVSFTRGLYVLKFCEQHGVPAVNRYAVAAACGDKTETSLRLRRAGVPTPNTKVAFEPEAALAALDQLGYPAVIKPTMGSWARMVARVDSRREAEQILEHRSELPNPVQQIYYLQQYVKKETADGLHRDLRAFVVGDETICAIWRNSPHWITNTARGGKATVATVTPELHELCQRAAAAVGGGVLALDLMEGPDGLTCHEINHTMEFRNSVAPTGVDIPGKIIDFCVREAKK
ncbi:MAG: lysine biosynthesis protein LysX [Candidatus Thermoplasmatota archaeon]